MNSKDCFSKYTVRQMKKENEMIGYRLIYEIVTGVLELSLLIGCLYGFIMLLVEYR